MLSSLIQMLLEQIRHPALSDDLRGGLQERDHLFLDRLGVGQVAV
jgi:hypothetical protein